MAHNEGLGANWAGPAWFLGGSPCCREAELHKNLLSLATTRTRHVGDDPNVELYDPDLWTDEFAVPESTWTGGNSKQFVLRLPHERSCVSKVAGMVAGRASQGYWSSGASTTSRSIPGEPERYRKDVPNAEVHVLDAGHFALDTAADEIAALVRDFVGSSR